MSKKQTTFEIVIKWIFGDLGLDKMHMNMFMVMLSTLCLARMRHTRKLPPCSPKPGVLQSGGGPRWPARA